MATSSVQFYITVDEMLAWSRSWIARDSLHAAAVEYFPYMVYSIGSGNLESAVRSERTHRLLMSQQVIDCDVAENVQLIERNGGALIVEIGRLNAGVLAESQINAMGKNDCWKRVVNDIRRATVAGMVGTHDRTGASAVYRTIRYSHGAAELYRLGTKLRPFNGSPVQMHPNK